MRAAGEGTTSTRCGRIPRGTFAPMRPVAMALLSALCLLPATVGADEASDQRYSVQAGASEIEAGSRGEASFSIAAADGWQIPSDLPAELTVRPLVGDDVLAVAKKTYDREDGERADDGSKLTWTVEMVGHRKGEHPVAIRMKFQVCARGDAKTCHVHEASLRMKIPVK